VLNNGPPTPIASDALGSTPSPPPSATAVAARAASTGPACDSPQPEPECCYIDRSEAIAAEEARLRLALIGQVSNITEAVGYLDVLRFIVGYTGVAEGDLSVKFYHHGSFLVLCSTQLVRDRILAASPIPLASTFLSLRPWTRLVNAEQDMLFYKVEIEVDGIPAHAWDLDTASKLLAPQCWIERQDEATASKSDMSTFKVSAWTKDPASIPAAKTLLIAEPEIQVIHSDPINQHLLANVTPYLQQKRVLQYPVDFHLRAIFDFGSRTPSSSGEPSHSDDGDSGPDGNPNRSSGFQLGSARSPRVNAFPRRDSRRANGHRGGGGGRAGGGRAGGGRAGGGGSAGHSTDWSRCVTTTGGTISQRSESTTPKRYAAHLMAGFDKHKDFPSLAATTKSTTRPLHGPLNMTSRRAPAVPEVGVTPDATLSPARTRAKVVEPLPVDMAEEFVLNVLAARDAWAARVDDPMSAEASLSPRPLGGACTSPAGLSPATVNEACSPVCMHASPVGLPGGFPVSGTAATDDTSAHHGCSPAAPTDEDHIGCPVPPPTRPPTPVHRPRVDVANTYVASPLVAVGAVATSDPLPSTTPACLADSHVDGPGRAAHAPGSPDAPARNSSDDDSQLPADSRLEAFADLMTTPIRTPLAQPPPPKTGRAARSTAVVTLPKRSSRIASQSLANVPVAKRGEIVVMRRLGFIDDKAPATATSLKAYNEIYRGKLQSNHIEAMDELFPSRADSRRHAVSTM